VAAASPSNFGHTQQSVTNYPIEKIAMLVNRLEVLAVSKRILQNKLDAGLLLSASAAPRSFDDNETLFDVQRASSLHLERAETSHEGGVKTPYCRSITIIITNPPRIP
jgi:hypothetical protein